MFLGNRFRRKFHEEPYLRFLIRRFIGIAWRCEPRTISELANGSEVAQVPDASAVAEIPAHHRKWSGGSNGTLRLKDDGIDYLTENDRDNRSWRWDDIQTIASPYPHELRVTGFREIVEFDLKRPLSRDLFERMWDRLYAAGLNLSAAREEVRQ